MTPTSTGRAKAFALGLTSVLAVALTGAPASAARPDGVPVTDRASTHLVAKTAQDDEVRYVDDLPLSETDLARQRAGRVIRASLAVTDTTLEVGDVTAFSTKGSRATRGLKHLVLKYGDGTQTRARKLSIVRKHAYSKPGSYVVRVVVTDKAGRHARTKRVILVGSSTQPNGLAFGAQTPKPEDQVTRTEELAPGDGEGLPASVDLRGSAVPVGNQGSIGSCVSWTTAYGMMGWFYKQKFGQTMQFAPMYVYSQTHGAVDSQGNPGGSWPKDALEVLRTQGVDTRDHYGAGWATAWNVLPNASQRANAANYRITGWERIYSHGGLQGSGPVGPNAAELALLKGHLAAGHPVAMAFRVRSDFYGYNTGWYNAAGTFDGVSLHEMLVLGYDANGLYIQNSWGTSKGVNGYVYMTWDAVKRDMYDANFAHGIAGQNTGGGDSTKPTVTSFGKRFAAGYTANDSQAPMTFSWAGSDNVGVTKYLLYYRLAGGEWTELAIGDTQTSVTYNLGFGNAYQFAVAAYDGAGNLSDWALSSSFTPSNYTEASGSYSAGWSSYSNAGFMNGVSYESGTANAQMSIQVTGSNFALVGTKGPAGGRAHFYLDGAFQFTQDNYSASASYRNVVAWFNFGSHSTHTITVVVEGTTNRPWFSVDSFLLS